MDESEFVNALVESPGDEKLLHSYATWLIQQGDQRGEFLQLELERVKTKTKLLDIETKLQWLAHSSRMEPAWLDVIFPLEIVSPMVGKFYAARTPDSEPFVKKGDICEPNTIVAVIEAMKVFNEIPADFFGVISEILISNEDTVEYGQPMFRVSRLPTPLAGG